MTTYRFCAYCDQLVEERPEGKKLWTQGDDQAQGEFQHKRASQDGIGNCGRRYLTENQTYTETVG